MTLVTFQKIRDAVEQRPGEIEAEKKKGKIVVGWIGYFIPEEIIHALGLIPVRLGRGGDERLVELGARYISSQNCAFIRACMGMFADNTDPYIRCADLMVFDNACMQVYRLGEVAQYYSKKKTLFLGIPRNPSSRSAHIYFLHEVGHFTQKLEALAGRRVDIIDLAQSIELYQNIRRSISELYRYLSIRDSPLNWKEVNEVVHAGYYLDKNTYYSLLQELLGEIKSLPILMSVHGREARIILSGSLIAPGDKKLSDLIDQINGTVVSDDLWSGLNESLNMHIEIPTIAGIADAYLNRIPHYSLPCFEKDSDIRFEHLKQMVLETKAQGIIYHTIRYCDPATLKTAGLKNRLKKEGIPLLEIHTEYSDSDVEAIRTRVEAFFEVLSCKRETGVNA